MRSYFIICYVDDMLSQLALGWKWQECDLAGCPHRTKKLLQERKTRSSWWNREGGQGFTLEKYDAVHSPRKACSIKGCAASKYVALVAGARNTVDSSVLQKKKKKKKEKESQQAPQQNLCIETRHFTVSTRGQIHKRTPAKSSQNLYEWREPWSSWNILSLLLHTDWYLHQAAQTYLGYFLWSGKLSRWGWGHYRHRVWWASEAPRGGAEHCH